MRAIKRGTSHLSVGRQRLLGPGQAHVVMMLLNGGQPRGTGLRSSAHLVLFLLAAFSSSHDLVGAGLVRGVVQQSTNVVNEQRVQELCDLLLVGEVECPLKRNPASR